MTVFRAGRVLSVLQQLSGDEFVARQLIGGCALATRALILTDNLGRQEIVRPFAPSR